MGIKARLTRIVAAIGMLAGLAAGTFGIVELTQQHEPVTAPPATAVFADNAPAPVVPAAPEPAVRVAVPTRLEVPAIGVDEKLTGRGLKADGSLDTPDFGKAGWYRPGPRPGEPGGAVVVAHVHGPDGPDVFWDLAKLQPGDLIRIHRADAVATFVVDEVDDVPKEHLPYDKIWPDTDEPLLRLITCGGKRTSAGYPDNTVVYAHLASTESLN